MVQTNMHWMCCQCDNAQNLVQINADKEREWRMDGGRVGNSICNNHPTTGNPNQPGDCYHRACRDCELLNGTADPVKIGSETGRAWLAPQTPERPKLWTEFSAGAV